MRKATVLSSLLIIFLVAPVSASFAQTTGTILGSIKDKTGAVLPGVSVTVTNTATGEKREAITDDQGNYTATLLPPSVYKIECKLTGFKTTVREGVRLSVLDKIVVDVIMEVGEIAETITVSEEAPLLQTVTTALGRVVDEFQVRQLPLATRNYMQILTLFPGTSVSVPDTAALGRGTQNISTSGARLASNSFYINGVDANNVHTNSATENAFAVNGVAIPASDAIREFKVQTSMYDAQFGRNAGANVNVVTKSGGAEYHGNVYEFFRNDALNANNFFFNRAGSKKQVLKQNQYGFTFGGPIIKNKAFGFGSYQGTRQINGASFNSISSLSLPPIPAVRTRQELGRIFGGRIGVRGGVAVAADGSNINPVALALLNTKLPNGQFVIPSPLDPSTGKYVASIPARYKESQFNVNIDHELHARNRISGKFFYADTPQTRPFAGGSLPGFTLFQDFSNRNLALTDLHTFSPRLMNEVRVGLARLIGVAIPEEPISTRQIGMRRFNDSIYPGIPLITVTGAFSLGHNPNNFNVNTTNTFTYADTLSLIKGAHNLRFGFEFKRHQSNFANNNQSRGSLVFASFPDFLLGLPGGPVAAGGNGTSFSNIQQSIVSSLEPYRNFRSTDFCFFLQDDWKVSNRLTLNLGLRYDLFGAASDRRGRIANFDVRRYVPPPPGGETSSGFVLAANTISPLPGLPLVKKTMLDATDKNNIAPRVGLTYKPFEDRNLVIRAGYGIFYDRVSNQMALGLANQVPPFNARSNLAGQFNSSASFQEPFATLPLPSELPVMPRIFSPPFNPRTRPTINIIYMDPGMRTPYLQHYTLNLQYEFARDFLLEVGYVGSKGTKLLHQRLANQSLLASPERPIRGVTENTPGNAELRAPILGLSPQAAIDEAASNSNYNSLQGSVTKRFSRGLQFLASYTLSKSIDTTSGGTQQVRGPALSGDQTDPRKQPRGVSDFDRTHRFIISWAYDLPAWGFGWNDTALGRKIFAGWQVAGITTFQSGTPFSITDPTGAALFGSNTSRASFAPGATIESARRGGRVQDRLDRFFDTSAFSRAGLGFGNTGRNILRGPGQRNWDFSIIKKTPLERWREGANVEFRAEVFNLFNHANFANPDGNVTSATFGTILNLSSNSRIIQFALKINY